MGDMIPIHPLHSDPALPAFNYTSNAHTGFRSFIMSRTQRAEAFTLKTLRTVFSACKIDATILHSTVCQRSNTGMHPTPSPETCQSRARNLRQNACYQSLAISVGLTNSKQEPVFWARLSRSFSPFRQETAQNTKPRTYLTSCRRGSQVSVRPAASRPC